MPFLCCVRIKKQENVACDDKVCLDVPGKCLTDQKDEVSKTNEFNGTVKSETIENISSNLKNTANVNDSNQPNGVLNTEKDSPIKQSKGVDLSDVPKSDVFDSTTINDNDLNLRKDVQESGHSKEGGSVETTDKQLHIYDKYITKLEDLASIIEKQFKENSLNVESHPVGETVSDSRTPPSTLSEHVKFCNDTNTWFLDEIVNGDSVNIDARPEQRVKISNCNSTTFNINGETSKIEIDGCVSCNVIANELGVLTIRDCKKLEFQVLNSVSKIYSYDTDGLLIFLSPSCSKTAQLFIKKCSEVNVSCPTDDGHVELPVPDQMRTYWDGKRWISECYSLNV